MVSYTYTMLGLKSWKDLEFQEKDNNLVCLDNDYEITMTKAKNYKYVTTAREFLNIINKFRVALAMLTKNTSETKHDRIYYYVIVDSTKKEISIVFDSLFHDSVYDENLYESLFKNDKKTPMLLVTYKYESANIPAFICNEMSYDYSAYFDENFDYDHICLKGTCYQGNFFNIITNYYILDLALTVYELKDKNISLYTTFQKKKKSGGYRTIIAPNESYKYSLRLLNNILGKKFDYINDHFQVAYKKKKSIFDNTLAHKNNKYMYKIDLHDFYGSCKSELVETILKIFVANNKQENFVESQITPGFRVFLNDLLVDDKLFMGNPASGCIANRIIAKPVAMIYAKCKAMGIAFTVYADDMTFSSNKKLHKDFILSMFKEAFTKCNMSDYFTLSENKCYGCSNNRREVTGLVINHKDQITVKRSLYNNCKVTLHQMKYNKPTKLKPSTLRGNLSFMYANDTSGKFYKLMTEYKDVIISNHIFSEETWNKLANNNLTLVKKYEVIK